VASRALFVPVCVSASVMAAKPRGSGAFEGCAEEDSNLHPRPGPGCSRSPSALLSVIRSCARLSTARRARSNVGSSSRPGRGDRQQHRPDRRAWHLAIAAAGPDEPVAEALEESAGRAQGRGGLPAPAASLHRSVVVSSNAEQRVRRAVAAARASLQAGMLEDALELLALAEASTPDELQMAHVELLRGQVAFASNLGAAAPPLLLKARQRLERLDPRACAGDLPRRLGICVVRRSLGLRGRPGGGLPPDRLRGRPGRTARLICCSKAWLPSLPKAMQAAPLLRRVTAALADEASPIQGTFRWGWMTTIPPNIPLGRGQLACHQRPPPQRGSPRGCSGPTADRPGRWAIFVAWRGDFGAAADAIAEAGAITRRPGPTSHPMPSCCSRRCEVERRVAIDQSRIGETESGGQGLSVQWAEWVSAILFNRLGLTTGRSSRPTSGRARRPRIVTPCILPSRRPYRGPPADRPARRGANTTALTGNTSRSPNATVCMPASATSQPSRCAT
jgi:hypothetical protein